MAVPYQSILLATLLAVVLAMLVRRLDRFQRTKRSTGVVIGRFKYFKLPRELRDQIPSLVVIEADRTIICKQDQQHSLWNEYDRAHSCTWRASRWYTRRFSDRTKCACGTYFTLLLVSRQMSEEAQHVFFKHNRLVMHGSLRRIENITTDQLRATRVVKLKSFTINQQGIIIGREYPHILTLRTPADGRGWSVRVTWARGQHWDHLQSTMVRDCSGCEGLTEAGEKIVRRFLAGSGAKPGLERLTVGWMEKELSRVKGTYIRYVTVSINV
ncbi:hypothetical protein LTR85_010666 [Meristemomyces frigidus]|nr:hypothetical protein LTR85_010666 [Meristemomyces frigidus]